jgi:hypothetical protein
MPAPGPASAGPSTILVPRPRLDPGPHGRRFRVATAARNHHEKDALIGGNAASENPARHLLIYFIE